MEVAGIEPAVGGESTPANKRVSVYSPEALIKILTEVSGKTCRNGSRVGEIEPLEKAAQTALHAASRLELSQSGDSETLVEVAGIEPASRNTSDPASTRVVHLII